MIRRLLLALALSASLAPAFAQAPPPVPALPDTERRTSYSISGTTCACSVGFQLYGDSTDYSNWLEVFVNGARANFNDPSMGWAITSPSNPSLAVAARPITDAVLTFNSAQTGTIQIVGARRPRRVTQFSESAGVPARNLNQAFTDIIAMLREDWDKINDVTGRAVLAPPGETLTLLASAANRSSHGACFDSGGNLVPCVSIPTGTFLAGNGITITGTNPFTITNNISAGTGVTITGTNPLVISSSVVAVDSIAALKALAPGAASYITVRGYYGTSTPGGGLFFWNAASSTADNGGTIIIPNAGGTGRWIRVLNNTVNSVTPEQFGAQQTAGVTDDAVILRTMMTYLNGAGGGVITLSSVTYNMCSVGANHATVNNLSNVDIVGSGRSSILKFCNNLNTSSAAFALGIYPASFTNANPVNNARYAHFVVDMNAANNSCSGTCYAFDAALGAAFGDNISVNDIVVLNNPGSMGISFGAGTSTFPTLSNLVVSGTIQENSCKAVNAACTDYSGIQIRVLNGTVTGNTVYNVGAAGTGIELHGFNVTGSGNTVWSAGKCMILAADASAGAGTPNMNGVTATGNTCGTIAITGIDIWASTGASANGVLVNDNYVQMTGAAGNIACVDASSNVSVSASTVTMLSITGNTCNGGLSGTIANVSAYAGFLIGTWSHVMVANNTAINVGGPGIFMSGAASTVINVSGNIVVDCGRVVTPGTLQTGILSQYTGTIGAISAQNNVIKNLTTVFMTTGVLINTNAGLGVIAGNVTHNVTTPQGGSGTGLSIGVTCGSVTAASVTTVNGIITHC